KRCHTKRLSAQGSEAYRLSGQRIRVEGYDKRANMQQRQRRRTRERPPGALLLRLLGQIRPTHPRFSSPIGRANRSDAKRLRSDSTHATPVAVVGASDSSYRNASTAGCVPGGRCRVENACNSCCAVLGADRPKALDRLADEERERLSAAAN